MSVKPSRSVRLVGGIIACLLLTGCGDPQNSAASACRSFAQALLSGNYAMAYGYLARDDAARVSEQLFAQNMRIQFTQTRGGTVTRVALRQGNEGRNSDECSVFYRLAGDSIERLLPSSIQVRFDPTSRRWYPSL